MSGGRFFVRRIRPDGGRVGWVGPMPAGRALREVAAWRGEGWCAEVLAADGPTWARVRAWQREVRARRSDAR